MNSHRSSALFREARHGSRQAISAVFARYGERLHALIRLRLGARLRRRLDSRDILQATLLKAFQGIERFEGSGSRSLMAWMGTIAQAEICDQADFYGRQKRDAAREETLPPGLEPAAEPLRSEVSRLQLIADGERLERAIDALDEDHREVVLLRNFEELTFAEVGERMDRSADACRMLYARALAALTLRMRGIS